jgi:hypothetical protein
VRPIHEKKKKNKKKQEPKSMRGISAMELTADTEEKPSNMLHQGSIYGSGSAPNYLLISKGEVYPSRGNI